MAASSIPILTFHDLADDRTPLAYPPALFAAAIEQIVRAGLQVISLADWAGNRDNAAPSRQVIFTFDDGYRSFYEVAYPLLKACGMSATVFVTPSGEARVPDMYGRARLSWGEIREMQSGGIAIGAHSLSHPDFTTLPDDRIQAEMRGSQAVLQDMLGEPVRSFAYPYGRFDARSAAAARDCFDCAVTTDLAMASPNDDLFALPRVEMAYFRHPLLLNILTSRLLNSYLAVRRGPRMIRQRLSRIA